MEPRQLHLLQGKYVRLSNVQNVHVIAQAGSVGRWIIRPVDFKIFPPARSGLQQQWNDVRFGIVSFAPMSPTPTRIKVAEYNHAPAVGRGIPFQNLLKDELAFAVRVHWLFNVVFRDRNYVGRSIDSSRRRKDEFADAVSPKSFQHRHAGSDVGIEKRARGLITDWEISAFAAKWNTTSNFL